MTGRLVRVAAACVVGLAVAAGVAWWQFGQAGLGGPRLASEVAIGGPFRLLAHDGRTVTDADFRGKFMLIYFGYTYCPDVCPTSLYALGQALERLGPAADRVQPLFITIDPERDTPELLGNYVPLFHDRMLGLTGSPAELAAVAKAYRVYAAKAKSAPGEPYLMDHSTFTYLMGPDGKFLTMFPHGTSPERMAESLRGFATGS